MIFQLIGFCGQENYALLDNTVYENLTFFAQIKGISKSLMHIEVYKVMNQLKLIPFKNTLVSNLQGGWKRKLNIGIALLNNPKLIIMDEPTSG